MPPPLPDPLGVSVAELSARQRRLHERIHERAKVARRAAPDLPAPVLDVRAMLRVESPLDEDVVQEATAHDEPAVLKMDPMEPLRRLVIAILCEPTPSSDFDAVDTQGLHRKLSSTGTAKEYEVALAAAGVDGIDLVLKDLASGDKPFLELEEINISGQTRLMVMDIDRPRLLSLVPPSLSAGMPALASKAAFGSQPPLPPGPPPPNTARWPASQGPPAMSGPAPKLDDLEALLSFTSFKERMHSEAGEQLQDLLGRQTAKESATMERFKTKGGPALREYCQFLTKDDCRRARGAPHACPGLHFIRIIQPHTDVSLGDCNYLDTCNHMRSCKRVHYELDPTPDAPFHMQMQMMHGGGMGMHPPRAVPGYLQALGEPQWINCDVRSFDYTVLGKFGVIMADPPWEIHMDLPYGIITDDEMRLMDIQCLQDDGVIFLWVTGRAMELGRELLEKWGYNRVDELIWVKINQLQRIIRTGRTGHWLNHSKEHCLVGYKGNPNINKMLDVDVLISEVRETSRKPDEMYPLLERLSPGTRKLEIFGRPHNTQAGWITLGNQLEGVRLVEDNLRKRFLAKYPEEAPKLTPPIERGDP